MWFGDWGILKRRIGILKMFSVKKGFPKLDKT
jgi:hypothetical protein